jgi:hypothetical protein
MSSGAVTIIPQQLPRRHVHPRSDAVAGIARAPVSAAVLARSQPIGKVAALDSRRVGMSHYNESRIHRALDKDAPFHRAIERVGVITSQPVLGGLHHQYCRV